MTSRRKDLLIYGVLDWLSAVLSWFFFFALRKATENPDFSWEYIWNDQNLYWGLLLIPAWWIIIYSIFDNYRDIYRLSRMNTLIRTFVISLCGNLILFFTVVSDDLSLQYMGNSLAFLALFGFHFVITGLSRMVWLTRCSRRLKKGIVAYNTLIIGGSDPAKDMYQNIQSRPYQMGHRFVGYIRADDNHIGNSPTTGVGEYLPFLGTLEDLERIIEEFQVEEAIIAVDTSDHSKIRSILNILMDFNDRLLIKIIPDMYDIMLGHVRMNHVYGAVLIEIQRELMPHWQKIIKRTIDVVGSSLLLLITSPIILYCIIRVRLSSPGPVIFRQERIGKDGKTFTIYKFRSMYREAESAGPQLSFENDPRCTKWGSIMRKWRLDELPQVVNVLRGDMSLVGPRPERKYYIDQITEHAPHYKKLLKVRPGITSWGQVKYGYASDLEQMLARLKFDILYLENMSLALDFKILFYTIWVLFQGKGK